MIFVGGGEVLAEDGRRLAHALSAECHAQNERVVTLIDEADAAHDWPLLPWLDVRPGASSRAMDRLAGFLLEATGLAEQQQQQVLYGL
jgi:hypothetical protein